MNERKVRREERSEIGRGKMKEKKLEKREERERKKTSS